MIQSYSGEFTISPIPLEMSLNYCSHACAYCFANLNSPNRKYDANKFINDIKNCKKNKSLKSRLLAEGYSVLLSNRVDPFAHSNWRQSLQAIELLHSNGNKIAFQTKGGQGIDEALDLIDYKTNFYISIGMYDDLIRQVVEPGAPSIQSRFELIDKLKERGHSVSVGINPLVEEWLPEQDMDKIIEQLKKSNVSNIWMESLHLNGNQIKQMTKREKDAIGKDLLESSKKRANSKVNTYFRYIHETLRNEGFEVYSMNQPYKTSYFDEYHKNHKGFKTHQDFINYCYEKYPNGGEIKWNEYYSFMKNDLFEENFSDADGYVYRIARNVWKRLPNTPFKTLKDVLRAYWENSDISKSLLGNSLFSVLSYKENNEDFEYICKEDNTYIYYFHGYPANVWRHYVD